MNNLNKFFIAFFSVVGIISLIVFFSQSNREDSDEMDISVIDESVDQQEEAKKEDDEEEVIHPMSIKTLRQREYFGGDFIVEQILPNGTNYRQSVVSYKSEGLKIYGLLTVPLSVEPEGGYAAVVFVHGYIPPKQYSTVGNYPTYQAALARSGVITFKPDLRGHGKSEGEAVSAHHSEKYVVDAMHAISYLKSHELVNPDRIGYWGHSNGGEIGLRVLVISPDIKAASFWAGVVGSQQDMLETYNDKISFLRNERNPLIEEYDLPSKGSEFWKKIDPYYFLDDISVPVELQHGTKDSSVPIELSLEFKKALEEKGKEVRYFEYEGDDHNIGANSSKAWQRTIEFFKEYL